MELATASDAQTSYKALPIHYGPGLRLSYYFSHESSLSRYCCLPQTSWHARDVGQTVSRITFLAREPTLLTFNSAVVLHDASRPTHVTTVWLLTFSYDFSYSLKPASGQFGKHAVHHVDFQWCSYNT